jgi:flagellar assembly protein FliH
LFSNEIKKNKLNKGHFKPYCFPELSVGFQEAFPSTTVRGDPEFKRVYDVNGNSSFQPNKRAGEERGWEQINATTGQTILAVEKNTSRTVTDIEEEAYRKGFMKGEQAGLELIRKKAAPVVENLKQTLLEASQLRKQFHFNAEKEVVSLALAVSKKVICHEVTFNKEVLPGIVRQALLKVVDNGDIKIKLRPSDVQFFKDARLELIDSLDNIEAVEFVEDETIQMGGCVIETNIGEIDSRIEKQLQIIEAAFQLEIERSGT